MKNNALDGFFVNWFISVICFPTQLQVMASKNEIFGFKLFPYDLCPI